MKFTRSAGQSVGCRQVAALLVVCGGLGLVAPSCKSSDSKDAAITEGHADVSQQIKIQATVKAIDVATRAVTLERADGAKLVVIAGPEVANFAQIAVGDRLTVSYVESLAVDIVKPGQSQDTGSATIAAGAAKPGEKPAAAIGARVGVVVRIESVDTKQNIVVFSPPDGVLRTVKVARPEGREFIKQLKPGDMVEISYTEALAASFEKR